MHFFGQDRMQSHIVTFNIISSDSDAYLLSFSSGEHESPPVFQTMSEAIQFRIAQMVDQQALTPLGLSSKFDFFDLQNVGSGFIEMDLLYTSSSVVSFEAYLYDVYDQLRGKASCTVYFQMIPQPLDF
jgi:hypothetical protein